MVELTTSWTCENLGRCLKTIHLGKQGDDASDFPHFDPDCVELDHCVRLERFIEKNDEQCFLKFESESYDIGTLVIVSEAKRLEVSKGGGGEYIKTLTGSKLEGIGEEMRIYSVEANLVALSLSSLCVRLTGISESCWIISCQVGLVERKGRFAAHGKDRFNLKQLDGVDLSDKAKEFKKLMESMRPQEEDHTGSDGVLLPLISSISSNSSGQGLVPTEDLLTSLLSNPTIKKSFQPQINANPCAENDTLVMKSLSSIEERILSRIDDIKKEQDEKLNRIMTLLEQTRCTCRHSS